MRTDPPVDPVSMIDAQRQPWAGFLGLECIGRVGQLGQDMFVKMAAGIDQDHLNALWSGPGGHGQLPFLDDIGHHSEKQVLEDLVHPGKIAADQGWIVFKVPGDLDLFFPELGGKDFQDVREHVIDLDILDNPVISRRSCDGQQLVDGCDAFFSPAAQTVF